MQSPLKHKNILKPPMVLQSVCKMCLVISSSMLARSSSKSSRLSIVFKTMWLVSAFVISGQALAQSSPSASSSSRATSAGTTVNNQNNSQINTSSFYGFGPGINCPTPTFSVAGFGGSGSGVSDGDVVGANVTSDNYGGVVTLTFPIGGEKHEICKKIGESQVQVLQSQVERTQAEARKTQADINLVTAIKCVELLKFASLSGQFKEVCEGVTPNYSMK